MDLTHPLRSLVPSLDADVLEVLAGVETGLGLSQITRLADRGSRMGISHVVARLVEHGLVVAAPANQGYLYCLNREHVLAPVVLTAVSARSALIERLTDRALGFVPAPVHVSLVGSFARREAGPTSDIDILVVAGSAADLEKIEEQVGALSADVQRWTGNPCQCLSFTATHLRRLRAVGEPIVDSWVDDAVLLVGTELAVLVHSPRAASGTRSRRPPSPRR